MIKVRISQVVIAGILALPLAGSRCSNNCSGCSAAQMQGNGIELTYYTSDGWRIEATFFPCFQRNRPLLVSIHMLMSDRSYYPVRRELREDYNLLKIDMRGHGSSLLFRGSSTIWRSGKGNIYWGSFLDIRQGIREVRQRFSDHVDMTRVFLQGSSYSCVLILQYYLKYPEQIKGLVFMSPGDSYGQRIVPAFTRMLRARTAIPVFHVCSKKDPYCISRTRQMEQALQNIKRAGVGKSRKALLGMRFIYEDEHVHGTHFFYTHRDKYPKAMIKWMNAVSGESSEYH